MFSSLGRYVRACFSSAFVAGVYLFLYTPIVVLVIFSFNSASFPAPWSGFTLFWYKQLFLSTPIIHALYTSLIVAVSATALSLAMTLGVIYYHVMVRPLNFLLTLFYGNVLVPEVVLAVGLLSFLSFFSIPLGIPTLIVAHTVLGLGYAVPIVVMRLTEIDSRLTEASLDLGATPAQTFVKITLPLLAPALIAAGLLIFIISFDDFILSFFCAGSTATTLSLYIFGMLKSGISPVVNALSSLLLVMSSILVLIFCSLNIKTRIF